MKQSFNISSSISKKYQDMFTLMIVLLGSAHCLMAQSLPAYTSTEDSSEEVSSQAPGDKGTSCPCGWTNKMLEHGRVIGGKESNPNEFPFVVGVYNDLKGVYCGGAIITEKHILTAAHCTYPFKNVSLLAVTGTSYLVPLLEDVSAEHIQIIGVAYTIEHEDYSNKTKANDIAIMVLEKPIEFNQYVGPVCMPTEKIDLIDQYVKVTGWGYVNYTTKEQAEILMKVNLKVVDMKHCDRFRRAGAHVDHDKQICSFRRNKDSCGGDSGGALLWLDPETKRLTQVGLVSYGVRRCGEDRAGVNTNVFAYLPWIQATIAVNSSGTNICQKV